MALKTTEKYLLLLCVLSMTCKASYALDTTSHRLKSLNSRLVGVVADEYTGIIFNPARNAVADRAVHGKFSSSGSVATLGYLNRPSFVLAEGGATGSKNTAVSVSGPTFSNTFVSIVESQLRSDSNNAVYDVLFSYGKPVSSAEGKYWGFGVIPGGSNTGSLSSTDQEIKITSGLSGLLIANSVSKISTDRYNHHNGVTLKLGRLSMHEQKKESEWVLSGNFFSIENSTRSASASYIDYDPDRNGIYDVIPTPTNSINTTDSYVVSDSKQQPSLSGGINFEIRWKEWKTDAYRMGARFMIGGGLSSSKQASTTRTTTVNRRADNVNIVATESASKVESDSRQYYGNLTYSYGGAWKASEQLSFMFAARLDGSGTTTTSNRTTSSSLESTESRHINSIIASMSVPLAAEYNPFPFLAFRAGWAGLWSGTFTDESVDVSNIPTVRAQSHSYGYSSDNYTAGLGLSPLSQLVVDFQVSTTNLSSLTGWLVQAKWLF